MVKRALPVFLVLFLQVLVLPAFSTTNFQDSKTSKIRLVVNAFYQSFAFEDRSLSSMFLDHVHPKIDWATVAKTCEVALARPRRGKDLVEEWYHLMQKENKITLYFAHSVFEAKNKIAAVVDVTFENRKTKKTFQSSVVQVFLFDSEGILVKFREYGDTSEIIRTYRYGFSEYDASTTVRKYHEAMNIRDMDSLRKMHVVNSSYIEFGQLFTSDYALSFYKTLSKSLPDFHFMVNNFTSTGTTVFVNRTLVGTYTGEPLRKGETPHRKKVMSNSQIAIQINEFKQIVQLEILHDDMFHLTKPKENQF